MGFQSPRRRLGRCGPRAAVARVHARRVRRPVGHRDHSGPRSPLSDIGGHGAHVRRSADARLLERSEHVADVAVGHRREDRALGGQVLVGLVRDQAGAAARPADRASAGTAGRPSASERPSRAWPSRPWSCARRAGRRQALDPLRVSPPRQVQLDAPGERRLSTPSSCSIASIRKTCERVRMSTSTSSRRAVAAAARLRRCAWPSSVCSEPVCTIRKASPPRDRRRRAAREAVSARSRSACRSRACGQARASRRGPARAASGRGHDDRRGASPALGASARRSTRRCRAVACTRISSSAHGSSRSAIHGTPSAAESRAPASAVS